MRTSLQTIEHVLRYVADRIWPMALLTCACGAFLIFVLPLHVSMTPLPSVSTSYLTGFHNSVAIRSAAGLSVLVYLWALWRRGPQDHTMSCEEQTRPIGRRFLLWLLLINATILSCCGWVVVASGQRYLADAGYFIEQASVLRDTGRPLYTGIEFAYGPLLIWPEVWISRLLHCSMSLAYFGALVVESSLGLLLLAYVLNQIPTRRALRQWTLGLFALAALTPHLGLNYTYFRFASPLAALLYACRARRVWPCAGLMAAGVMIEFLISPELAFVFLVGAITFAILRALQEGFQWLLVGVLPAMVLAVVLATAGRPYLQMASSFTRGALNLPVGPYPHILILLLALLWMVPFGAATFLCWRDRQSAGLLAMAVTSIAFMQAALGRCDPIHVVFNGVGVFALSLLCFRNRHRRLSYAWVAALALLVLWSQFVNQRFFQLRTASVLAKTVMPRLPGSLETLVLKVAATKNPSLAKALTPGSTPDPAVNLETLETLAASSCIATPLDITLATETQLVRSHLYHPGFYAFGVDVMNVRGERRSIQDVNECPWMLLPSFSPGDPNTPASLATLQGLRFPYKVRNEPLYIPGEAFLQELQEHWTAVKQIGPYALMRKNSSLNHP